MSSHTLILIQYTQAPQTRTFYDYKTVSAATEGVIGVFERHLKEANPSVVNLTYDLRDLLRFLDQLTDMSALVFDPKLQAYIPYAKAWIKEQVANSLVQQHQGGGGGGGRGRGKRRN